MGLRYRIPFKDINNNSYEVQIYREDYTGETTELTGATSCFVVSGTDEDFMYHPVRTSSATLSVLDSDLLLDLYSINNQYAPVKLLKNGSLEWTGYIKPEQYTQPYSSSPQNIGVECVCSLSTLEYIEYKQMSVLGSVTMWQLLKHLINNTKGGYKGVYIPNVYVDSSGMIGNVLDDITLIENNFTNGGMNCLDVLEAVCKFLNWAVHDIGGYLYFVDIDWKGEYHLYDETLSEYTSVSGKEILIQDVGYNGSDVNRLDVVHGYNKASVKALNNVFDEIITNEDYDTLEAYNDEYLVMTYKHSGETYANRRKFLKPKHWKLYSYFEDGSRISDFVLAELNNQNLNNILGAILTYETEYKCESLTDTYPKDSITDFDYQEIIQMRISEKVMSEPSLIADKIGIVMEGEYAVYSECAISIDGEIIPYYDNNMIEPFNVNIGDRLLKIKFQIGDKYYNGTSWTNQETTFSVELDNEGKIVNEKTPFSPYKGLKGHIIPVGFAIGKPIITIYIPSFGSLLPDYSYGYCTGSKLKGLKFGYAKKEGIVEDGENGDRIYENVVNESYMSECEEIEFDISSYNNDGASFSKAILKDSWLTNNLYCKIVEKMIRPEELMIRRIVNRYGATKIKLTEALQMTDSITPLTFLTERTQPGKMFRMTSGEWDYEQGRLIIQIQEDIE